MQGLPPTPITSSPSSNASSNLHRASLVEGSSSALTPGRSASAQVIASEPSPNGQGYRVQVQLAQGEALTLRLDRPLAAGQEVQLLARKDGQIDVRLLAPNLANLQTNPALSQLLNQLPSIQARPLSTQSLPLQPGQALLAQVVGSQTQPQAGSDQGSSHRVQLQLPQGQQVTLITDRPLPPGQTLYLQRPSSGQGLEVRPLNLEATQLLHQLGAPVTSQRTAPTQQAASLQTLLKAAGAQLRQALPRQAPLNQLLPQLNQLARQLPAEPPPNRPTTPMNTPGPRPEASMSAQPRRAAESLGQQLTRIFNLVPQGQSTPTAQQLKTFIPASGLLMEAHLVRTGQPAGQQGDLKRLLQQASAQIRSQAASGGNQALPQQQQLSQLLQAAQARIQVLQQTSLQATNVSHERGQPAQVLQVDLPYSVRGEWLQTQLEIRRWIEEKDAEAGQELAERKTRSWDVQLSFDLKHWGALHTRLKLTGSQLKADVWVERSESWKPIQEELSLLETRLRRLGAEVERIDCHLGKPPQAAPSKPSQHMIDTEI